MNNELTILGSSSALPTSQRFSSAQVVKMLERFFLVDCGEGTQIQLRRAAIPFVKIRAIFISHLHGDHFLGIYGVISSFNLLGRKTPLTIYAPKGFKKMLDSQMEYLFDELVFELIVIELSFEKCSKIYDDKKVEVHAILLKHRVPSWGFYFVEKQKQPNIKKECVEKYNLTIPEIVAIKNGGDLRISDTEIIPHNQLVELHKAPSSYAYISDTIVQPQIAEYIAGVNLLYHEATFLHKLLARAKATFHSTAKQAAEFAQIVQPNQLLIGHFSARYSDASVLENEAKEIFPNTTAVKDLQTFSF